MQRISCLKTKKGIDYLKHLISVREQCVCSKRVFHFATACIQNGHNLKKFAIDNKLITFQTLTQKRLLSLQLENNQLQNALLSVGFTLEEIENCSKDNAELLKYSASKIHNIATALMQQGMAVNDVKEVFLKVPHIVEVNIEDLNRTITKWRELRVDEEKLFRIFTKSPLFLTLTPEYIDDRLNKVVTLFTNSDVFVLLETMPSIFVSDWNMIIKKFHYVQSFMGFTQIQMMRTSVLEHSLNHIKARHMFISLSGIFKTRNPKKIILNNPSLKSIVDSTDQEFVKKCGLTLEEYYIFCDIMAAEEMDDDID